MMEAGVRIEASSATIIDICGARSSTTSNQNAIIFYYANGFLYRFNTTNVYASTKSLGDYTLKTTTLSNRSTLSVSGVESGSARISQSASFSTSIHYLIFNFSNNGTAQTPAGTGLKIKYFKLYDGETLVRDYVPVRKDGVGYLYDKVSGELFGNAAASGAFSYGNDVSDDE